MQVVTKGFQRETEGMQRETEWMQKVYKGKQGET
jgi:hypothetical protein